MRQACRPAPGADKTEVEMAAEIKLLDRGFSEAD